MQGQAHARELDEERQRVDEHGGEQGEQGQTKAKGVAERVDQGPARGDHHPSGHVGEEDQPDDPGDERPEERKAILRPGARTGDDAAHIDEAADGGEDPERQT